MKIEVYAAWRELAEGQKGSEGRCCLCTAGASLAPLACAHGRRQLSEVGAAILPSTHHGNSGMVGWHWVPMRLR